MITRLALVAALVLLPGAASAGAPDGARARVDHHLRQAESLMQRVAALLARDCPRFATPAEWDAYLAAEVDTVILLMAHLQEAWREAKTTEDNEVRQAAKAPRRRAGEGRPLLEKLQACAEQNGSSVSAFGLYWRIRQEVPKRQALIALPPA